ncbi:MAG: FAD/NAD(P)-binding oxidoreductase [Sulfolobaceae archaeon]|nr:FAD/NAD(P)-binding oxidoreductase [Sulfolobaceae archaeon]
MKRIAILGGGAAGTMVANRLAKRLYKELKSEQVEITLFSKDENHIYWPGYLFVAFNLDDPESFKKREKELLNPSVKLQTEEVNKIDLNNRTLVLKSGASYQYDYLVIATGSEYHYEEIQGYDSVVGFYDEIHALKMRETLNSFSGGKIVVNIARLPIRCPPAPAEGTLILDDILRNRGIRNNSEIIFTTPINMIIGIKEAHALLINEFEKRGIQFVPYFTVASVDPQNKVIESQEGDKIKYDLLIGVPPHSGAQVIKASEIGDRMGWVPTDKYTLQVKDHPEVYAIGDATDLPISKAGATADFESYIIVDNIISDLRGEKIKKTYDGSVMCFAAAGLGKATVFRFNYTIPPNPPTPLDTLWWVKLMYNKLYWDITARAIL